MDEISSEDKYSKDAITLTTWDVVAVVLYFVTILSVGISVSILSLDESLYSFLGFLQICMSHIDVELLHFAD